MLYVGCWSDQKGGFIGMVSIKKHLELLNKHTAKNDKRVLELLDQRRELLGLLERWGENFTIYSFRDHYDLYMDTKETLDKYNSLKEE